MKTLRESLFDQDISADDIDEIIVRQYIEDNYRINKYTINAKKHTVDVRGSVYVKNYNIDRILPQGWTFGNIGGDFSCSGCMNITSLEGSPSTCDYFNCTGTSISNFKYAPRKARIFICAECKDIKSLNGLRNYSTINCSHCDSLVDLTGSPDSITGSFVCNYCPNLKTLKGSPRRVESYFSCIGCDSLTDLTGSPEYVGNRFICSYCKNLKSLKGSPAKIIEYIECENCPKLTSLENDSYIVSRKIFYGKSPINEPGAYGGIKIIPQ